MQTPLRKDLETPLRGVRPNIVQSIRAFRVQDLQDAATSIGHHFLYANLAHAQTKQDVLDLIATQFTFPAHFGKNFDALYDCMTDPLHKSGPQPGFIVVLEQIPGFSRSRQCRHSPSQLARPRRETPRKGRPAALVSSPFPEREARREKGEGAKRLRGMNRAMPR